MTNRYDIFPWLFSFIIGFLFGVTFTLFAVMLLQAQGR